MDTIRQAVRYVWQNLDIFLNIPLFIVIAFYGLLGSNQNAIFASITGILGLISFSLLKNRHQNHDIQKSLQNISAKIQPSLTAEVYHSKGGADDRHIYNVLTQAVERAESSILAVSIAKPASLDRTSNRERYHVALKKNLEDKLKAKKDFTFARIFQVESIQEDCVSDTQMDSLTLDHCEHLIEIRKKRVLSKFTVGKYVKG